MKKLFLAMALIFSADAMADLSIDNFNKLSVGKVIDKQSLEMYVGGVVKGYLHANSYLQSINQPMLFCMAGDIDTGLSLKLASDFVKNYLSTHPGSEKEEIVELLLLMNLKESYPC